MTLALGSDLQTEKYSKFGAIHDQGISHILQRSTRVAVCSLSCRTCRSLALGPLAGPGKGPGKGPIAT